MGFSWCWLVLYLFILAAHDHKQVLPVVEHAMYAALAQSATASALPPCGSQQDLRCASAFSFPMHILHTVQCIHTMHILHNAQINRSAKSAHGCKKHCTGFIIVSSSHLVLVELLGSTNRRSLCAGDPCVKFVARSSCSSCTCAAVA